MTLNTRILLLVLSILLIVVTAFLLFGGPHREVIASKESRTSVPTSIRPVDIQRSNIPPPKANSTGTVDICGFGHVQINKSIDSAGFQQIGILTKDAGARWLSALQNSGDLHARVAGLLLEGKVTGGEPLRPVAEQTRNEVVQLAVGAGDPAVYALALSMCGNSTVTDADGACRKLSLQGWARMDPDNAVPWLLLAGKARDSDDNDAEADAFSHAATTHKIDAYTDSLFTFSEPELPPDVTPLERFYLAIGVIGVEAAIFSAQYSVAIQHCSRDAMQESTVRRQCGSLAELLVTKGSNLLDLGTGKAIGERAGWPSERIKKLALEQDSLIPAIMLQSPPDESKRWTCEAVRRMNAYVMQRARLGELGAARDALEHSGVTPEEMARQYNQHLGKFRREARKNEDEQAPVNTQ